MNRIMYGNEIFEEHGQKLLEMTEKALSLLAHGLGHLWLVDFFPLRKTLISSPNLVRADLQP
jgi:hypothetical protein